MEMDINIAEISVLFSFSASVFKQHYFLLNVQNACRYLHLRHDELTAFDPLRSGLRKSSAGV